MKTYLLHQYISSTIEEHDKYALDVLYFCLRRTIEKNGFSLVGIHQIDISAKFHPEPVHISIIRDYPTQQSCIALLLSLKAIILDNSLINSCNNDELYFKDMCIKPFQWVRYASVLFRNKNDDDFYNLFCMLEKVECQGNFSEKLTEEFHHITVIPPFRNLETFYKKIASGHKENTKEVIVNNAYLGDTRLYDLEIPIDVAYIGNTAFSYCKNLQKITFLRNETMFGKFPIIECPNLKRIIVPEGSETYYKAQLPYYKYLIFSEQPTDTYTKSRNTVDEEQPSSDAEYVCEQSQEQTQVYDINKNKDVKESVDDNIDIKKLNHIFQYKSTTYKYFWFLAILEIIKNSSSLVIYKNEIVGKMISLAWPLAKERISFGTVDRLHDIIQSLLIISTFNTHDNSESIEEKIKQKYEDPQTNKILSTITQNVPYRFLSPWIKFTTNNEVMKLSQSADCITPYALYKDHILLDENWFDYFIEHYDELHNKARIELMNYLKSYNESLSLQEFIME